MGQSKQAREVRAAADCAAKQNVLCQTQWQGGLAALARARRHMRSGAHTTLRAQPGGTGCAVLDVPRASHCGP